MPFPDITSFLEKIKLDIYLQDWIGKLPPDEDSTPAVAEKARELGFDFTAEEFHQYLQTGGESPD